MNNYHLQHAGEPSGQRRLDTYQKALEMNMTDDWYGTLAEIGAGQETSQWLFHVGKASHTVAKTISAYDMTFSDSIYGKAQRYVSRQRLRQMLDHEFDLLHERLGESQGDRRFFCFANTAATRRHTHPTPGQGWLGVRFQLRPGDQELSHIVIHVNLLDMETAHQQEAMGVVGINLLYGAFCLTDDPALLIESLIDRLNKERIEVDMIDFGGPVGQGVDNRIMSMELVSRNLTDAAMFTCDGENVELADRFHNKPILLQRGQFRPVVLPVIRMAELSMEQLEKEAHKQGYENPVIVAEMNLRQLDWSSQEAREDLLARLEILEKLNRDVLITDYRDHYQLAELLAKYTQAPIAMVMGVPTLRKVLDKNYYKELEGGFSEAMGRLFKKQIFFCVYPYEDADTGKLITLDHVRLEGAEHIFLEYLRKVNKIIPIEPDQSQDLSVFPNDVLQMIHDGTAGWQDKVPDEVAKAIEQGRLFGYTGSK